MNDPPPLKAVGLSRSYGKLQALRDFSLTVVPGQCVALIGANGSGKSTAVRLMAGLLEPSAGEVRVEGFDPHTEPEAEEARARLALVPDNPLLYGDLTVREHVELVAVAHGIAGAETDARIDALLDRLGLAHRRDFRPAELSRGMRQKAQLACALIRPAAILLLDEPVVGLDPHSQALLHAILLERKATGCAVLLTTHQLGFADGLADRGLLLGEGEVLDEGGYREVAERAAAEGWEIA
ncbi:MAG: type transport system ATP-binding protein [Solirubrobacteraceae bacterium]|jgi:ABC-2 type transport system ATP-binding protein|nr:type transport system ATP-binding protein [Solirubrobacteraceae bacterium]MEA2278436.1 type transport system ATP-binding protein [Solirubrobacteraceae bacterium]MEA2392848.1 type transport system ATP-binding protein [Solirubrobacteraceae bacterium]